MHVEAFPKAQEFRYKGQVSLSTSPYMNSARFRNSKVNMNPLYLQIFLVLFVFQGGCPCHKVIQGAVGRSEHPELGIAECKTSVKLLLSHAVPEEKEVSRRSQVQLHRLSEEP